MQRKVTSAIDGMSVAEVRRALDVVRKGWNDEAPFHLTAPLFNGMTQQQFCGSDLFDGRLTLTRVSLTNEDN